MAGPVRSRIRIEGIVQGVGFRPFVHLLARRLRLHGLVGNDTQGVFAEVEGEPSSVERFLDALESEAPPLAVIERIRAKPIPPTGEEGFVIVASEGDGARAVGVSPDMGTCADCLREIFDPTDRRHRYPFTNCTNCGPRFTIIRDVPYDRALTTMAAGQTNEGKAFLYPGSAAGLAASPRWTAESNQASALFGFFVSSAGDVNGDGYGDVVVGAPNYDHGQVDEGAAFAWYGSALIFP